MGRRGLEVVTCVLLGIAATLSVAWMCLLTQEGPRRANPLRSAQDYWDSYAEFDERHRPASFLWTSSSIGCELLTIDASSGETEGSAKSDPPRMRITRAGFPFFAFEAMHSWGPVSPEVSGGIPIEPRNPNVGWVSVLPCRPIPFGFVVNSLLYAALAWMVFFGPFALYRHVKALQWRSKNCCPSCGYNLRGEFQSGCPECGWGRDVKSET